MNMSPRVNQKVTPRHLKRQAYCYVRQSTLKQVFQNTESTKRQYALRERAIALGWPIVQIVTVDSDLGETATSVADRQGFQKLMTEVSLGRVGLVMGLEVSRLARNNADWSRLLEICAITDTLILDEEGVYDPTDFNDRLLLNMKGTFSEVELHVLRSRLRGGILSKARRGELKTRLPTGFIYDHNDKIMIDPDQQVQKSIRLFFDIFQRTGAAFATVKAFAKDDVKFPCRIHLGPDKGQLKWQRLTSSRAQVILKNPRYAGAYYYGRQRSRKNVDGSTTYFKVPRDEWRVLIKDAHPGYITWDQYEQNLRRLRQNAVAYNIADRKTSPREGPCLLQGLAICGKCGQRMTIRYKSQKKGKIDPVYLCQRHRIKRWESSCQYIPGATIDEAISKLLLESITLSDHTYSEIATILDNRGYKSGQGHRIDRRIVTAITHKYSLKTRYARLRATGKLTVDEVANLLGVTGATVRRWGKKGTIKTYPYNDRNGCLYENPGVNSPLMKNRSITD
ncbi:recombinase family protein [uncultured Desulfobacter sp.]|uniref:recombinase family protein n=1 Tax=uncultured Desulfobacter sp. TaxID=240139 RepID=UPI0029F48AED|nr:recombinase family protein [uncultured Desulfobacter sp.]